MADKIEQIIAEDVVEKPYDASDPEQVNDARKKSGRKKTNRLRVVQAIMELEDGRAYMYNLLERCHIFGNPFVRNDPYATHFMIGESNIGRLIMADVVECSPEGYLKMCEENKERK